MTKQINEGRYNANIRKQGDEFYVLVTRDGDCLPGIGGRFYKTLTSAEKGARTMLNKAMA